MVSPNLVILFMALSAVHCDILTDIYNAVADGVEWIGNAFHDVRAIMGTTISYPRIRVAWRNLSTDSPKNDNISVLSTIP